MRHGQSVSNVEFILNGTNNIHNPLTKKGEEQVKKIISSLKDIDLVLHSPLLRTKQSAQIIGKHTGATLQEESLLTEINFGGFEGRKGLIVLILVGIYRVFSIDVQNMETDMEVYKRVKKVIDKLENKYANKTIMLVTHRTPLRFLQYISKNIKPFKRFDRIIRACLPIKKRNACLAKL